MVRGNKVFAAGQELFGEIAVEADLRRQERGLRPGGICFMAFAGRDASNGHKMAAPRTKFAGTAGADSRHAAGNLAQGHLLMILFL